MEYPEKHRQIVEDLMNGRFILSREDHFEQLKKTLQEFADARGWQKFHSPKNLAMALMCESGELQELFQWLTEDESRSAHRDPDLKEQMRDEIADVMLYLVRLADQLQINLNQAIYQKIEKNAKKYPAGEARLGMRYEELFTD